VKTGSHRILVLDDDPSLLRAIRLTLVLEGFEVETAVDGVLGLELLADNGFSLVVLDLQMPRMNGSTFFQELRSLGYEMPVLILSAYGAEVARQELGANGAIAKPFDPEDLVAAIRRLIGEASSTTGASPS
jgi:DNA-binding response OmpR family regulator